MVYMIWFVLDTPDLLDDLLDAWHRAGVSGATIIESTGIYRRRKQLIPMRYLFQTAGSQEVGHYTLMAVVKNEAVIAACLQATEALVGNLDQPNTGIFAAWPLTTLKGLPMNDQSRESE